MYSYLQIVIMRDLPFSIVEDKLYREFSNFDEYVSRKTLKEVLFCLVELVKQNISSEMIKTRGAIMNNGRTNAGTHYVGLFAVYTRNVRTVENNTSIFRSEVVTPLLSMSPMSKLCRVVMMKIVHVLKRRPSSMPRRTVVTFEKYLGFTILTSLLPRTPVFSFFRCLAFALHFYTYSTVAFCPRFLLDLYM